MQCYAQEDTKALAIRGIELLQDALREHYGMEIKIGAELEFTAKPIDAPRFTRGEGENPLGAVFAGKYPGYPKVVFRDSPFITNTYKESGLYQYELVFGHENNHGSPVVLARAIEAAKKQILKNAAAHRLVASLESTSGTGGWIETLNPVTNGLHINISLWKNGENIFGEGGADNFLLHSALGDQIINASLPMQAETLLLHAPKPDSFLRLDSCNIQCNSPKYIENGLKGSMHFHGFARFRREGDIHYTDADGNVRSPLEAPISGHIENRLAGADADPYQVVLATLATVYYGLERIQTENNFPSRHGKIRMDFDRARDTLAKGTLLRELLNNLSPDEFLGDRLVSAVVEKSAHAHKEPLQRSDEQKGVMHDR